MNQQLVRVEAGIQKIQDAILNKAAMVQDANHFLTFYFSYLSVYIPLLEFAVEVLPEDSLARIANFGMLIDHLSTVKLDRALAMHVQRQATELTNKTGRPASEVLALLNDMTIGQKVYIAGSVLQTTAFARDVTLCAANSKFNASNKIVSWANIFGHVLRMPAFADSFIDPEMIQEASKELEDARERVQKQDRSYDRDLSLQWCETLGMSQRVLEEIPKLFVGPKVTWLLAMEGLELARCILEKNREAGERALSYNEKLQSLLSKDTLAASEWSYRDLNSGGPCIDLRGIIKHSPGRPITLIPVTSQTIFVHTPETQYFLEIPGILPFYTNPNMIVQIGPDLAIPVEHDLDTIILFHKSPALFVCNNLDQLSAPSECALLQRKKQDRALIEKIMSNEASLVVTIGLTYGNRVNKHILDMVGQIAVTSFEGTLLYSLLYGFEKLAQAKGVDLGSEGWSQARLAITAALLAKLRPLATKTQEMNKEGHADRKEKTSQPSPKLTAEDNLRLLYGKLEESQSAMCKAVEELNDTELTEIMKISAEVRDILLSGLSQEETLQALARYSETLELPAATTPGT